MPRRHKSIVVFTQRGNRNGSNVATFANEVNDCPMFLSLLQMREVEIGQFSGLAATDRPQLLETPPTHLASQSFGPCG